MKVATYSEVRQNLAKMLDRVRDDHEPLLVTRSNGDHAVLMSLADFNAYEETLYLMSNPANAARLTEGLDQIKSGKTKVASLEDLSELEK